MGETVYLKQMELGPMQNFVYLIGDPETRECLVVDAAWEIDAIVDQVERDGMKPAARFGDSATHQDHVGGHLFGFTSPASRSCSRASPSRSGAQSGARVSAASGPIPSRSTVATRCRWGG
jgi:hypothetical protein